MTLGLHHENQTANNAPHYICFVLYFQFRYFFLFVASISPWYYCIKYRHICLLFWTGDRFQHSISDKGNRSFVVKIQLNSTNKLILLHTWSVVLLLPQESEGWADEIVYVSKIGRRKKVFKSFSQVVYPIL